MANQGELRSCSSFQLSGLSPDLADLVSRSPAPSIFPEGAPQYIPGLLGRTGSPTQVGPGRGRRMCLAGLFVSKPSPGPVTVGARTRVTCLCCPPTSADVSRRSLRSLLSWLLTLSMIFSLSARPVARSSYTIFDVDPEELRRRSNEAAIRQAAERAAFMAHLEEGKSLRKERALRQEAERKSRLRKAIQESLEEAVNAAANAGRTSVAVKAASYDATRSDLITEAQEVADEVAAGLPARLQSERAHD
jgi:hypothetical protein